MSLRNGMVFIGSFLIFNLLVHGLGIYVQNQHETTTRKQAGIILENVRDRFKLFIRTPISVGLLGAEHFATNDLLNKSYGPFNQKLLELEDEIIGLNILDKKGVIIRVFPEEMNRKAMGHTSQNINQLMASYKKGKKYWFSPPFQLFQELRGFAVYFPIVSQDNLKGWFATVISTDEFIKRFKLEHFLSSYELIILDKETNKPYYATALEASPDRTVHEVTTEVDGRELVIKIWSKNGGPSLLFPWSWIFVITLVLSTLTVILWRINEQRRKVRNQLSDVSLLLKLTSKEALSKLVDLQSEMYKLGSSETIKYITHLIEQIDLLQTTANTKKEIAVEHIDILPSILTELNDLKELTDKKNLHIQMNPENFSNASVNMNAWIFKTSILSNVMTHLIVQAEAGTGIGIDYQRQFNKHILVFHAERLHQFNLEEKPINLDRRIGVTKKLLNLFDGDLQLNHDLAGGLIIRLNLPIPERDL
jgi:hypothetical protein